MALIKCSECGKEISDTANACINCGCPIVPNNIIKTEKKYNNIGLIVGGIITLVISLFLFEFGNIVNLDIELILYALLGVACLYISILFFVLWKRKSSKKKINIFVIISTISFLVFSFCCLIYIINWSYIIDVNIGNVEYVKELEVNGVITNEEEKQEETSSKPNNNTNNNSKPNNTNPNNTNPNNTNPNNITTSKVCDERAKQQLTNEYNTTLEQRTNEYNTNINKVQQQIDFAKQALDTTGGYLTESDFNTQYQQAISQTQKEMLKNRYGMSVNYDKMVNTFNELKKTFETWKETYKQWYQEELSKIGC